MFCTVSRMAVAATLTFADRLAAEVERKRSQLCVGLDPRPELMPVELRGDISRFCCGLIDAVAQPYASMAAQQDAEQRAADEAAAMIRTDVALALAHE